jgi:hypothetical protein
MFYTNKNYDEKCTVQCNKTHPTKTLILHYHTHNPIIQNPNQNQPTNTNPEKTTLIMPKHIYTKYNTTNTRYLKNNKKRLIPNIQNRKQMPMQMDTPQQYHIHQMDAKNVFFHITKITI